MTEVFQILAAGGDAFTIGVCIVLYLHNRRIERLETIQQLK